MVSYFILAIDNGTNEIVVSENDIGTRLKENIHIPKKKKKYLIENFNTLTMKNVIDMIEKEDLTIYTVKELVIGYYVGSEVFVVEENNNKYLRTKETDKYKNSLDLLLSVDAFYLKYDNYID